MMKPTRKKRFWLTLALTLVLALVLFFTWRQKQSEAREQAQSAQVEQLLLSRHWDEAIQAIQTWERASGGQKSALAWVALSRAELGQKRFSEAQEAMAQAFRLGYDQENLKILRAAIESRIGRQAEAEPVLIEAWNSWESRSKVTGDVVGLYPEIAESLVIIYFSKFLLGAASQVVDAWAQKLPSDPRPWHYRYQIDTRLNQRPEVLIQDCRNVLDRDPDFFEARQNLAMELRKTNRIEEAFREFQTCLVKQPDSVDSLIGAARCLIAQNRHEEGIPLLEKALQLNPKDTEALLHRASIDMRINKPQQTLARLDEFLKIDPHDPEAHYLMSFALRQLGRTKEAEEEQKTSRRLREEHAKMDEIRKSLLSKPNDRQLWFEAAQWLLEHDRDDEGKAWTNLILKNDPKHKATHELLSAFYKRRKELGLANYHQFQAEQAR